MDLLRFHLFTMGSLWEAEYGSPDNEVEFEALRKISPLHSQFRCWTNDALLPSPADAFFLAAWSDVTSSLDYPPTLLTTAEHDSRVIPGHSLKLAATLQGAHRVGNVAFVRCHALADDPTPCPSSRDRQTRRPATLIPCPSPSCTVAPIYL